MEDRRLLAARQYPGGRLRPRGPAAAREVRQPPRDRREQACTDSDVAGEDQHLVRVGRQRPHEAGPAVVVELEVQVGQDSQAHSWEESMSGHSCNAQRQRDQAEERILGEVHVLQRKAA